MSDTEGNSRSQQQSVYIVRYGLTEFPLQESVGPFNSDIDPTEGIVHANQIAESIAAEINAPLKTIVYTSPFTRCCHTAQIIANALQTESSSSSSSASVPVRVEEGLTEWLIPSLLVEPSGVRTYPRSVPELVTVFPSVDTTYQSVNPVVTADDDDPHNGASPRLGTPRFEETEPALLQRCATTLDRILDDVMPSSNEGSSSSSQYSSLIIVSHAPCDQSLAFRLEGTASPDASALGPWPLGGITKFTRLRQETQQQQHDGPFGAWQLEKYGDTSHMPGEYKTGLKFWSLGCFDKK